MATELWQCNARGVTLEKAARRFATTYWEGVPRKVENLKADPNDSHAMTFNLVGGVATYSIYFVEDTIVVERL